MRSIHNLKKSSSWFWYLLSKSADLSKPWGRFYQILCVSQKVLTLILITLQYKSQWKMGYTSFERSANSWSDVHRGHCFYNHYFSRSNLVLHLEPPFLSDVLWVSLIMSDCCSFVKELSFYNSHYLSTSAFLQLT